MALSDKQRRGRKGSHGGHGGHGVAEAAHNVCGRYDLKKGGPVPLCRLPRFTFTPPPGLRRNDPKPGSKPLITDLKTSSVTTVASVR
jgi:ribosomal protein L15